MERKMHSLPCMKAYIKVLLRFLGLVNEIYLTKTITTNNNGIHMPTNTHLNSRSFMRVIKSKIMKSPTYRKKNKLNK